MITLQPFGMKLVAGAAIVSLLLSCAPVRRAQVPLAWPGRATHDGTEALDLHMAQMSSPTDLVVGLTLRNRSSRTIQIVDNPQFSEHQDRGGRESEIEVQTMDSHHRPVLYLCADLRALIVQRFRALEPGRDVTFRFVFDRHCYDLVPEERLLLFATFVNASVGSLGPEELRRIPEIDPADWISLTVPRGWVRAN